MLSFRSTHNIVFPIDGDRRNIDIAVDDVVEVVELERVAGVLRRSQNLGALRTWRGDLGEWDGDGMGEGEELEQDKLGGVTPGHDGRKKSDDGRGPTLWYLFKSKLALRRLTTAPRAVPVAD